MFVCLVFTRNISLLFLIALLGYFSCSITQFDFCNVACSLAGIWDGVSWLFVFSELEYTRDGA